MKKLNFKKIVIVALFGATILGCSDNEVEFPSMSVVAPGVGEVETNYSTKDNLSDVDKSSPLFFRLGTIPETDVTSLDGQTDYLSIRASSTGGNPVTGKCEVPAGTAEGSPESTVNCTIQVPELTLNYSHLKFIVGTNALSQCSYVMFDPYLFRRSTLELDEENLGAKPGYVEPKTNERVNCFPGPDLTVDKACYGGAGPNMLSLYGYDIRYTRGMYFKPSSEKNLRYYYLESDNKTHTNGASPTNIYSANFGMPSSAPAYGSVTVRNDIVFGTLENMPLYKFTCQNVFREPIYILNITIQSTPGPNIHFWNWDNL